MPRARATTLLVTLLLTGPALAQLNQVGQDRGKDEEGKGPPPGAPRVKWRGTAAKWSQSVTTTALGVGSDYQSDAGQVYSHGYWVLLNYYAVEESWGSVRLASSPGFDVELTNSNSTTLLREPQMRDLNLTAVASLPVVRDAASKQALVLLPNMTVLTPTSEVSRKTGMYLVSSPRLTVGYQAPFLPDLAFPKSLLLGVQGRWDHRFAQATEPVSSDLAARFGRTSTTMEILPADNLSGVPDAHDTVNGAGFVSFSGVLNDQPLWVQLAFVYTQQYLYTFGDTCVDPNTGDCIDVTSSDAIAGRDVGTTRTSTVFDVSVQYSLMPELTLSVGYTNSASYYGPDGLARSPFYSPAAFFSTEVLISLDAIYEGLTGPRRTTAFYLPG